MINNAALDVAIGLILMYLMLSLLCTVINEFIATKVLSLRAKSLAAAMPALLDNPTLFDAFYGKSPVAGTKSAVTNAEPLRPSVETPPASAGASATGAPAAADHPTYISAETFTKTLISCLARGALPAGQKIPDFGEIKKTVEDLPPSNIKSALLSSIVVANDDIEAFRKNVATWFDDSMDRLTGAYKRNLKFISLITGLLIAVAFNADTFGVANTLWKDPDLRARVVAEAKTAVQNAADAVCHMGSDQDKNASEKKSGQNTTTPQTSALEQLQKNVSATEDCLRPFPIGWQCDAATSYFECLATRVSSGDITLLQVIGWLVTAAALTLGAPFWFDLLSKFVNIRGSGPKPQRADGK